MLKGKDMANKQIDQFEDDKIYNKIFMLSSGIMIFLLSVYFLFLSYGFDFLDFSFMENKTASLIIGVLLQLAGTIGVNALVYFSVYKITEIKWKKENKHMYLKGEWLTIHSKENVRIGLVRIEQSFKTIRAEAFNVSPKVDGIKQKEKSNWEYTCASLYPQQLVGIRLLGCYVSKKEFETIMGVHQIDSIDINEEIDQFPTIMSGHFCDTVKNDGKNATNISDNMGKIYFYKITPQIKRFLCQGKKDEQLQTILDEDSLKGELFVKKLESIISELKIKA